MKNTIIAISSGSILFVILHLTSNHDEIITYIPTLISALTLWLAGVAYFNWKEQREKELTHQIRMENQHILLKIDSLLWSFRRLVMFRLCDFRIVGPYCSNIPNNNIFSGTEEESKIRILCEELATNCRRIESIDEEADFQELIEDVDGAIMVVSIIADFCDSFLGDSGYREGTGVHTLDSLYLIPGLTEEIRRLAINIFEIAKVRKETIKKLNMYKINIESNSEIMKVINELKRLKPPETKY